MLDMRIMNPMKPWFVALTRWPWSLQSLGLDANSAFDRSVTAARQRQSKSSWTDSKLGYWTNCRKPTKNRCCAKTVRELDLLDKNIDEIVQSWAKGDINLLARLLLAGMKEYPEVYQRIVHQTEIAGWLPEIEKLIHDGSGAMLVVGAAHLVGQDGVIEMLKAKGYRVMAENKKNRAPVVRVANWMTEEVLSSQDFRQHHNGPAAHGGKHRVNQLPLYNNNHLVRSQSPTVTSATRDFFFLKEEMDRFLRQGDPCRRR